MLPTKCFHLFCAECHLIKLRLNWCDAFETEARKMKEHTEK